MSEQGSYIDSDLMATYMQLKHVGPADNVVARLPLSNQLGVTDGRPLPLYEAYDAACELVIPEAGVSGATAVTLTDVMGIKQLMRTATRKDWTRSDTPDTWVGLILQDIEDINTIDHWLFEESVRQGYDQPGLPELELTILDRMLSAAAAGEAADGEKNHPGLAHIAGWAGKVISRLKPHGKTE